MVGPGGPDGCSVMKCTKRAVLILVYKVAHPGRDKYDIEYKFCEGHTDRKLDPWKYPNFELIKEILL